MSTFPIPSPIALAARWCTMAQRNDMFARCVAEPLTQSGADEIGWEIIEHCMPEAERDSDGWIVDDWRDAAWQAVPIVGAVLDALRLPAPDPDSALTFDECDAAGVDGTGRFFGPVAGLEQSDRDAIWRERRMQDGSVRS